jgi:murein DD-endopeptidase MepM/ murein hydrolase activator NlpD
MHSVVWVDGVKIELATADFLGLALKWEFQPWQATQTFEQNGQSVNLPRNTVVSELQALPNFTKRTFGNAREWQEARKVLLDQLDAELKDSQPDPGKLEELKNDQERTGARQKAWETNHNLAMQTYQKAVDRGEMTGADAEASAVAFADSHNTLGLQVAAGESGPGVPDRGKRVAFETEAGATAQRSETAAGHATGVRTAWEQETRERLAGSGPSLVLSPGQWLAAFARDYWARIFPKGPDTQEAREDAVLVQEESSVSPVPRTAGTQTGVQPARSGTASARRQTAASEMPPFWQTFAGVFTGGAKVLGGAAGQQAKQGVGGKSLSLLLKQGGKWLVGQLGLDGLLAALPTGVTQVLAVLNAAKGILGAVVPQALREKLKDLASVSLIAGAKLLHFVLSHPLGLAMGGGAFFLGGPLGPLLAPVAFYVGMQLEGIIGSALASGGSGAAASSAFTGATSSAAGLGSGILGGLGGAASSFWGLATGSGLSSAAFASLTVAGAATVFFTFLTLFGVGIAATSESSTSTTTSSIGEGADVSFLVRLEVDPVALPGYVGADEATLKYTVTVSATGGNVEVQSIALQLVRQDASGNHNLQTLSLGGGTATTGLALVKENIEYRFQDPAFENSTIMGMVTVVGKSEGATETQTEAAVTTTTVGNVSPSTAAQPFGYPASGIIKSIDADPSHMALVNGQQRVIAHCGTILPLISPTATRYPCTTGGMDIAAPGGSEVVATLPGKVVYSRFNRGVKNDYCDPATTSGFCYPGIGGAVYIQSGNYLVAYVHLDDNGLIAEGADVVRGQTIGKIYPGPIFGPGPDGTIYYTSTGSHVHYQVLMNNVNRNFSDPSIVGGCQDGKILPDLLTTTDIDRKMVSPNFTGCR